jgi:hypothetical protein
MMEYADMRKSTHVRGAIPARLIIDLMHSVSENFLGESNAAAVSCDIVMLCAAMFVGQDEGFPLNASKLAEYIGMPRPSVIRKLRLLHKRGIVAKSSRLEWRVAVEHSDLRRRVDRTCEVNARLVMRAARDLSKLDTMAIAGREARK